MAKLMWNTVINFHNCVDCVFDYFLCISCLISCCHFYEVNIPCFQTWEILERWKKKVNESRWSSSAFFNILTLFYYFFSPKLLIISLAGDWCYSSQDITIVHFLFSIALVTMVTVAKKAIITMTVATRTIFSTSLYFTCSCRSCRYRSHDANCFFYF